MPKRRDRARYRGSSGWTEGEPLLSLRVCHDVSPNAYVRDSGLVHALLSTEARRDRRIVDRLEVFAQYRSAQLIDRQPEPRRNPPRLCGGLFGKGNGCRHSLVAWRLKGKVGDRLTNRDRLAVIGNGLKEQPSHQRWQTHRARPRQRAGRVPRRQLLHETGHRAAHRPTASPLPASTGPAAAPPRPPAAARRRFGARGPARRGRPRGGTAPAWGRNRRPGPRRLRGRRRAGPGPGHSRGLQRGQAAGAAPVEQHGAQGLAQCGLGVAAAPGAELRASDLMPGAGEARCWARCRRARG